MESKGKGSKGKGAAGKGSTPDIPKANIKRIMTAKLNELQGDGKKLQISKDALFAVGECTKIFIHYLMNSANGILREDKSKRSTVQPEDVLKAVEMVGLGEFKDDLEAALAKFKEAQAEKADAAKKRKAEATEGDGQGKEKKSKKAVKKDEEEDEGSDGQQEADEEEDDE